ncbi:hypothetical protein PybrP1_010942 [[Pythium] brassicae (nom. inval.)]|nr:hypothetical protein PybrP1_010942 [[Pythium] brassicae (nom. inval.)]
MLRHEVDEFAISMMQIHGEFRTGKTQLCHTEKLHSSTRKEPFGRNASLRSQRSASTWFVLKPDRSQMQAGAELTANPVRRIPRTSSTTSSLQERTVTTCKWISSLSLVFSSRYASFDASESCLAGPLTQNNGDFQDPDQGPFKLLIIDSVTALFRTDFSGRCERPTHFSDSGISDDRIVRVLGRGELSERQQRLNQHLIRLVKHAEVRVQHRCLGREPSDGGSRSERDVRSGLEAHRKVIDSPCMPEAECTIQLCAGGVADGED